MPAVASGPSRRLLRQLEQESGRPLWQGVRAFFEIEAGSELKIDELPVVEHAERDQDKRSEIVERPSIARRECGDALNRMVVVTQGLNELHHQNGNHSDDDLGRAETVESQIRIERRDEHMFEDVPASVTLFARKNTHESRTR